MKSKALSSIAVAMLVVLVAASSSLGTFESASPAATRECGSISEGASGNAVAACAQGYDHAGAHATLAASCALGVGVIEAVENQHDCKLGFILAGAGGVTQPTLTPSSTAASACASITRGASDGSPAACEQGYQDGLAGDTQDTSCDHLGAGAITAVEYATSCEDGWFVAKGEPACIPGIDPENGQQGTTIAAEAATGETCPAAY
jgi:hypothetical protein